uniref:Sushi domain-containing protein n=1 Tax=Amphimedon queenslandica TaxID=400682 RepID=A0A1X7V1H7_AMPQE
MSTLLLLLLFTCLFDKSNGAFVELTFNFTVNGGCTASSDADILSLWGRYAYVVQPDTPDETTLFPQCFAFKRPLNFTESDGMHKRTVRFEVVNESTFKFLRFLWREHSPSCHVSITHGEVRILNTRVQLGLCNEENLSFISKAIQKFPFIGYLSTYCYNYTVEICQPTPSAQIVSTSCPSATKLTPLSHTSLSLATLSQLPSKISYTSSLQSPPSPPLDLSSSVNSISHSSDFSLVSIQAPSATSSMPTSILSSASQINSFSIQATSSMPTLILSSASQITSFSIQATSSMPTLILLSASQINSFSIQATSSMPTLILSSASQINSFSIQATSSMPTLILSSASQINSFSIQATSSMPTSILSSASQINSFSIQATSSMPTLILSSASQINSFSIQATSSMPTLILSSASQINSFSIQATSSMPTLILSSASQINSFSIQATSSMPTSILSSASQINSFSIQATSSMPTLILSSASQINSFSIQATSSMPTLILSSASQINSFSIQATSSMPTLILSSASQIHSTSSMHILSSRPHSSNSGHTTLSRTTIPTVTSIFATTSSYHFNSPSPSLSPPLMNCPGTNQWESTKPGQWANGTCYKGTFNATRYCDLNGRWGQLNCSVSKQFIEIMSKINISHYDALESLSQQLNDFPAAQSIVLLDFIITNSTIESDNETIQWVRS